MAERLIHPENLDGGDVGELPDEQINSLRQLEAIPFDLRAHECTYLLADTLGFAVIEPAARVNGYAGKSAEEACLRAHSFQNDGVENLN